MRKALFAPLYLALAFALIMPPGPPASAAAPSIANEFELSVKIAKLVGESEQSFEFTSALTISGHLSALSEYVSAVYPNLVQLTLFNPSPGSYRILAEPIQSTEYGLAKAEASKVLRTIVTAGMSDNEKITAIHDYIASSASLSQSGEISVMTAYSVLLNRTGSSRAFASAFALMCELQGIPCLIESGQITSDTTRLSHYWNRVYNGTGWKYVDIPLDIPADASSKPESAYLLVDREIISADRSYDKSDYDNLAEYAFPLYLQSAETLDSLGLFKGTANGYELGVRPTRAQCAVMLTRLLGKENAVLFSSRFYSDLQPFLDVPEWAAPYVGYLWENKLANGVDAAGNYGSSREASLNDYLTFMLRLLGYSDPADFTWVNARSAAVSSGLISQTRAEVISREGFTRGDLAIISLNALKCRQKDSSLRLIDTLLQNGTVSLSAAKKAGLA